MRKDRLRAKKTTHKLTWDHIRWIREQQGTLSVREAAKQFARHTHYIYKVSPSMVHHIWSRNRWVPLECGLCELTEEEGLTFDTSKEICDSCYKIKTQTEEQKRKRLNRAKRLTNITSKLIEDETEMIDLPYRLREQIYKNADTPHLDKENVFRSRFIESTHRDPTEHIGAIYAIHFTHSEETESMVYVGQTIQGVLKRFKQHLADVRADSQKRPARCGTPAYRNMLRSLMRDNQHHTIKIQVLDVVDPGHTKKEISEQEFKTLLDELEQAWQLKLMVRGYTLLNASIKISASFQEEARNYMLENITKDPSDKSWLSSQGVGYFVGEQLTDGFGKGKIAGCSWAYEPLQATAAK
jgi:hypothetical protein